MKQALFCSLALLIILTAGCDKGVTTASDHLYKGVVLHDMCGSIVIKNIGFPALGQPTWTDSNFSSHPVYYDVFKVGNPCQFVNHKEGDTIYYRVTVPEAQTCAFCMLFVYTPSVSKNITVVQ